MTIKTALQKVWTWRRDREARRLRERIFYSFAKAGLGIETMKAAEDFIMAAPRKERKLREKLVMRYNAIGDYNRDGRNPKDPATGLRVRKALLVEGWLLRSELEPDQPDASALLQDSPHHQAEETNRQEREGDSQEGAGSARCGQG